MASNELEKLQSLFSENLAKFRTYDAGTTANLDNIMAELQGGAGYAGTMTLDVEKKKFQEAARTLISAQSPSQQLMLLQKIQEKLIPASNPWVLADPLRRTMSGGGAPQYTAQELYYFLSDHFGKAMNKARNHGDDPFYSPMLYPDDASMDQVIHMLIAESPYQKFLRLYDQYRTAKSNPEVYANRIKQIYKILMDPNHVSNPWYMTKFVKGQERPMESYRNEEFMATLSKFAQNNASLAKPQIEHITVDLTNNRG